MKRSPKVGDQGRQVFTVESEHAIDVVGDGKVFVLSTPALIWFLEHAARDALAPLLDSCEATVGVQVDVEHLATSLPGSEVICLARVIHVDGATVTFQVTAEDKQGIVARGVHRRRIVNAERFQARARQRG